MKGQIWSMDLAISLLIFLVVLAVAYTLTTGTLTEHTFERISSEAYEASGLLVQEGFPAHWTNVSVIRAGLISDDSLSLRKLEQLGDLKPNQLRTRLRLSDSFHVQLVNATNQTISFFGTCGFGDGSVSSTANNKTLPTLAIVGITHPISDMLSAEQNSSEGSLWSLHRYDRIVIEANLSDDPAPIRRSLELAAKRGITIVIVGDPGADMLGMSRLDVNALALTVQPGADLGLTPGETLHINESGAEIPLRAITLSSNAQDPVSLALTEDGDIAYARWRYEDADVYYLATVQGTRAGGADLASTLASAIDDLSKMDAPECEAFAPPTNAEQVAHSDRIVRYHDNLYTIRTIVWRT